MKIARVFLQDYGGQPKGKINDVFDSEAHPGVLLSGVLKECEVPAELESEQAKHLQASVSEEGVVTISLNSDLKAADAAAAPLNAAKAAVGAAIGFGQGLVTEFAAENVILGITADNMTGAVLTKMQGVLVAVQSGSLYEAITRAKAIPAEDKDVKYITDARLLAFVNKIETFLGVELSETL